MTRRSMLTVAVVALTVLAAVPVVAATAAPEVAAAEVGEVGPDQFLPARSQVSRSPLLRRLLERVRNAGNFVSVCAFSHRASDDPIVFPGEPGASHSHDFFGNTATDAGSTADTLRGGDTTCNRSEDTAAYWVPTLTDGGVEQDPSHVRVYYLNSRKDRRTIDAHPAGLALIAGTPETVRWSCSFPANGVRAERDVPTCPDGSHLILRIPFPDCWDGTDLDSADHRSHVEHSRRGTCPDTHPVPLPHLLLNVHYRDADGGDDVTLASGDPSTAHADFLNAWDQQGLERLVESCNQAGRRCGTRRG